MPGALQAHEFSHVFEVLPEYEALAFRDDGHVAHAKLQQALAATGVVQHVYVLVINAFTRKKLFRPKTTASSRLREQNELVGDGIHGVAFEEEGG
jgi:hypothetical protein